MPTDTITTKAEVAAYLNSLSDAAVSVGQGGAPLPASAVNQIFGSALSLLTANSATGSDDSGDDDGDGSTVAEEDTAAATSALELASSVLSDATEIDEATAADAAGVLDFVLESPEALKRSGAKSQLTSSISAIGDAVLQGVEPASSNTSVTVAISTKNLNITAGKRPADTLTREPALCQTESHPARVDLPTDVLASVAGVDRSQPIDMLFYASAVNLHAPPPSQAEVPGGKQPAVVKQSSQLISFSLRQAGKELKVNGTNHPISITVPLSKRTNTTNVCVGQPQNASAAAQCDRALECRFWDGATREWSGTGCDTKQGPTGALVCECNHLTDFVVFEFPSSWDDVLSDALSGFEVNGLSAEAFTCLAHPSPADVPFMWTVLAIMVLLAAVSITCATTRDRIQIDMTQKLVHGRRREQNVRSAAAAFQTAANGRCLGASPGHRLLSTIQGGAATVRLQSRSNGPDADPSSRPSSVAPQSEMTAATCLDGALVRLQLRVKAQADVATKEAMAKRSEAKEMDLEGCLRAFAMEVSESVVEVSRSERLGSDSSSKSWDEVGLLITKHEVNGLCAENGRPHSRRLSTPTLLQESLLNEKGDPSHGVSHIDAKALWADVRRHSRHVVLASRWYSDVNGTWKSIWLDFKLSHSLMAAIVYRGAPGYTRAQTILVLLNSLALELVILCMMYSSPSEGAVVINPVKIVSSGCVSALICMPGAVFFFWCFQPIAFVRFGRLLVVVPCRAALFALRGLRDAGARCLGPRCRARTAVHDSATCHHPPQSATPLSPPPSPPPPSRSESEGASGGTGGCRRWRNVAAQQYVQAAPESKFQDGLARRGAVGRGVGEIKVSYASLDEHLLRLSLRHALRRRDYHCAASIVGTWTLSWAVYFGLLLTFSLHGCEFYLQHRSTVNQQELLLSWGWSFGQRFLVNEPAVILVAKGLPVVLSSQLCQALTPCCTDSLGELFAMVVDVVVSLWRSLKV